jgi:sugar (pentulose or hexulose) kinase
MATGRRVLAIDVGTQSTRAALVDPEGRIEDVESVALPLFTPRPGWSEQAPEDWWGAAARAVRELLARRPGAGVEAVGVGAQMHGVVPVDARGRALVDRAGIWNDKRAADLVARVAAASGAADLARLAGNPPQPAWAGFKMAWLREERPDVYRRTASFLVVKDFVNHRLTGVVATDPSEASGSFLVDHRTGLWSAELVEALGLSRDRLPELAASTAVIGGVSAGAAAETGLAAGTPVVCGGGDMLCQLLAAGVTRPGRVAEVSGTASIVAAWADAPAPDPRLMSLRTVGAGWVRFGIADAGGASLRWFADRLGPEGPRGLDPLLDRAAAVPAGADGLLFFPYLLGERTLGSSASRASFVGLTSAHGRPEMLRAVLEGVCLELRRALRLLAAPADPVRVTGGGAASGPWNRIRADVYRRPVRPLASVEGGIRGAAILAGVGAGWYDDPACAAEAMVRLEPEVRPDATAAAVYDGVFEEFCALHDLLDDRWPAWARW